MPCFDHEVFQNTRLISWNSAVQARMRMRTADRGSQFIPTLPCFPTMTGFPNCFHLLASCCTRRSELNSFSLSYQCGALTSIAGRLAISQLVLMGLWSGIHGAHIISHQGRPLVGSFALIQKFPEVGINSPPSDTICHKSLFLLDQGT